MPSAKIKGWKQIKLDNTFTTRSYIANYTLASYVWGYDRLSITLPASRSPRALPNQHKGVQGQLEQSYGYIMDVSGFSAFRHPARNLIGGHPHVCDHGLISTHPLDDDYSLS